MGIVRTYKDLLDILNTLSEEVLAQNIAIYNVNNDEACSGSSENIRLEINQMQSDYFDSDNLIIFASL